MANNTISMNPAQRITTILNHNEESFKYLTNSYMQDVSDLRMKLDKVNEQYDTTITNLDGTINTMENDMDKIKEKLDKEIEERVQKAEVVDRQLQKMVETQNTVKAIMIIDTVILGICIAAICFSIIIG